MSNSTPALPLISLGRISGAHGLRGAVKVRATPAAATTDPADFAALGEVTIRGQTYQVLEATRLKSQVLLALAGVATRSAAEALTGEEILGDRRRLPRLPPGEYYWFELLNLPVINIADGETLGYLQEIISTPAHDVYVVRQGGREVLLPAVEEVIVEIDLTNGVIKAAPPAGLLNADAD